MQQNKKGKGINAPRGVGTKEMSKKLITLTAALTLLIAMLLTGGCARPLALTISGGDTAPSLQAQSYDTGSKTGGYSGCGEGGFSLTDDVPEEEDEQQTGIDRLTAEAQTDRWEQQPDEAAYMEMMKGKTELYYDYIAQMAELEPVLKGYKNAKGVRGNEKYAALEAALIQWSSAALDYPEAGLVSPEANSVRTLSCLLADSTVKWLEAYPGAVCGESDRAEADALLDELMDSAVQLGAHFA